MTDETQPKVETAATAAAESATAAAESASAPTATKPRRRRAKPVGRVEVFTATRPGGARVQVSRNIDTGDQQVESL